MKREEDVKLFLINNAIHLIAEGGFEKATTKEITYCRAPLPGMKMNEVYIYRLFGSKERLYEEVFIQLDRELFLAFRNAVRSVGDFESDPKAGLYQLFVKGWAFILGNEERCRCYVRCYYSVYFKGHALDVHREHFDETVNDIAPIFKDEADVSAIMHSVFTMMFDFCIRVYNGQLEDNEENRPHVFNMLYCMMATYFRDSVSES